MPVTDVTGDWIYPTGLRQPFATAALLLDDIAARHGLKIETWLEDGLGEARGSRIRVPSGRVFLLHELLPIVQQGILQLQISGSVADLAEFGPAALSSEAFSALELDRSLCNWQAPDDVQASYQEWLKRIEAECAERARAPG